VGDIASGILAIKYNKELIIGKINNVKNTFRCISDNIKCGIVLLLANYLTSLIAGAAKMVVQFKWGDITFGKISFGFSLTNLFLVFITAISVVLFPSLKRIDENRLPEMYVKIRKISTFVMFLALSVYHPISLVINAWIPKYSESIKYMLYLLPIIVFVTRTSLLTGNYFKIFRREKQLFLINIIFAFLGIVIYSVFAFVVESLIGILISVVVVNILISLVSEIILCRDMKIRVVSNILIEIVLCGVFYFSMLCLEPLFATIVYLLACLIYILVPYFMTKKDSLVFL
jgi:O-antigen/teichoic acid export membrane protein